MGFADAVAAEADVTRWRHLIAKVRDEVGPSAGVRILHLTDVHNRPAALLASASLELALHVDVTVNTGDLSGLPWPLQSAFLRAFLRFEGPYVFAPGNHDGERCVELMRRRGAVVLNQPLGVDLAGLRMWGLPDPNRTRFGRGDTYSADLSRGVADASRPDQMPTIVAVHSELMVKPHAGITLVLCGHDHRPKVATEGDTVILRPGAAGGSGPFGTELRFGVVDVEPTSLTVVKAWFVRLDTDADVECVV